MITFYKNDTRDYVIPSCDNQEAPKEAVCVKGWHEKLEIRNFK